MSSIKETLQKDLHAAMKSREELKTTTIRALIAAIRYAEVADPPKELTEPQILEVIAKESKKRFEAAEAFTQGNRPELAEQELSEQKIIAGYLPSPLTDPELAEIVTAAISATGASSIKQLGLVIKHVREQVGVRADGGRISSEVRQQLG